MKNVENKGFTLIELLAVIVILAIIALIAVPIILDIIGDTKRSSREITFANIERAARLYLMGEYETKGKVYPDVIKLEELVSSGYVKKTDEDLNNNILVIKKFGKYESDNYIVYYEGRDKVDEYKSLKELIKSDKKHIKENVVVNGNKVDKVYGTKEEQTTMKNYVLFSGQIFEVVEINETNHSIKLVSPVSLTVISYGDTNDWKSSWVRKWLYNEFYNILERKDLILDTNFCIDPIDVTPDKYTKMTTCTNTVTEKVGLLTYEDYIYGLDGTTIQDGGSFLDEKDASFTITPTNISQTQIWHTDYNTPGKLITTTYYTNTYGLGVRPVISIKDSVLVKSGEGTRANPYILSSERSLKENHKLNLGKVGDYVYLDESNNKYTTTISETTMRGINRTTSTSQVRYRIVSINEDGSIKLERADILRNVPRDILTGSSMYIPFYSIDTKNGLTSCLYDPNHNYGEDGWNDNFYIIGCKNNNIFNINKGTGDFEIHTGENIGYYLNNAPNSFYNWYSDNTKSMIVRTKFNLYTGGHGKDYSNLNDNPNGTYPEATNDGEIEAYVGLPSWGDMYTGNDLNTNYWYINRWATSSYAVFAVFNSGIVGWHQPSSTSIASRPVITLSSNVYITSGDGTVNNPYILDI